MEETSNGRISVSEEKLRLMLADFKLELFKELSKYATTDALKTATAILSHDISELARRQTVVELWRAAQEGSDQQGRRVSGAVVAWAAVAVSLAALCVYIYVNRNVPHR